MVRALGRALLMASLLGVGCRFLRGQGFGAEKQRQVDAIIQRCLREDGAPSASVAIVVGDRVVYADAFGEASLSPRVAATRTTRYQLASLSKTFTAQAVLQLEAAGKLSLDDVISRWYPEITDAKHITVRELLSHTAGLPDHYPQSYPAGPRTAAATPEQIIAEWGRHPLLFAPGTQFHYSNLDYEVAGRIVEKVSGEALFQYLQKHVFAAAGMTSAIDLDTIGPGSNALATGYVREALSPLTPAAYEGPGWSFGAGQIVTTAEDVAHWDAAFLENRVLPAKQAKEEVERVPLTGGGRAPLGLGLFVGEDDGVKRYYHTGQGLGFTAVNLIYPDAHLAVVVLSNTSATGIVMKIANELTFLLLPRSPKEVLALHVFKELQAGRKDEGTFSSDLKAYLTAERMAAYRASLSPLGEVESFESLGRDQVTDGLESRDYNVVAGGHRLRLHLLLLPEGLLEDAAITDLEQR